MLIESIGFTKPGYKQINEAIIKNRAIIFLTAIEKEMRRMRDSNPRYPFGVYTLSKRAP